MTNHISVIIPEPVEDLFNARRDGQPEVIVVNRALLSFPHSDVFPWHLRIAMEAEDLIDNGMPSPVESDLLFELGDEIEAIVLGGRTEANAENALFLARSTWNGLRELYYYVHDPEVAHRALQAALKQRGWEPRVGLQDGGRRRVGKSGCHLSIIPAGQRVQRLGSPACPRCV